MIGYQDYSKFSQGQGFAGALCWKATKRSHQTVSTSWLAVDCGECKRQMIGRIVRGPGGTESVVVDVNSSYLTLRAAGLSPFTLPWRELNDWTPA